MIIEYKLRTNQYKKYVFKPLLKLISVVLIFTFLSVFIFDVAKEDLFFVIGLTWCWVFLIHLLPLLILVISHVILSKDALFVVDTTSRIYRYEEGSKQLLFNSEEIKQIIKVVSPPKYDGRLDILGFGYFYYWKVILADGTILSLSCMLLDTKEFFGHAIQHEKELFPLPNTSYLPVSAVD